MPCYFCIVKSDKNSLFGFFNTFNIVFGFVGTNCEVRPDLFFCL